MIRRVGRPGLVGTMARTAVVAGTATAVAGGVRKRQTNKAQAEVEEQQAAEESAAQMAEMQSQLDAMQTQKAAPAAGGDDLMAQLEKLASLKESGVLSDEEFTAAKAKLLAS